MLRMLRGRSTDGGPGAGARVLAILVVIGLLATVSPFVVVAISWLVDLL